MAWEPDLRQYPPGKKPMPVRAAVGALAVAAAASLVYGTVQVAVAVAETRTPLLPDDPFESAIMAGFMFFAALGYGAAGYGVSAGRWGARQLGRLVSVVGIPTGLALGFLDYANLLLALDKATTLSLLVQAVQCLTVSAVLASALLGVLTLRHPTVASYLARGVGEPSVGRARVLVLRARVLLVTVGFALLGSATSLSAAFFASIRRAAGRGAMDPTTTGAGIAISLVMLALLVVPAALCLLSGRYLTRRGWARRLGLVALWGYACCAVPLMFLSALVMATAPAADPQLQLVARLGMAGGVMAEVIAAGCVVAAVLVLNHPGLQTYFRPGGARVPA